MLILPKITSNWPKIALNQGILADFLKIPQGHSFTFSILNKGIRVQKALFWPKIADFGPFSPIFEDNLDFYFRFFIIKS